MPAAAARRTGPTLAAATFLRGHYLETQGYMDGAEPALEAAAAYRLAREIWPDLGSRSDETRALVFAAAHRIAATSPEFGARWQPDLRRLGLTNIRERLAQLYPDRASLTLKSRPEGGVAATITLPLELTADAA